MERPAQAEHDASVGGASEALQRERRPERVSQQMLKPLTVALVDMRAGLEGCAARRAPTRAPSGGEQRQVYRAGAAAVDLPPPHKPQAFCHRERSAAISRLSCSPRRAFARRSGRWLGRIRQSGFVPLGRVLRLGRAAGQGDRGAAQVERGAARAGDGGRHRPRARGAPGGQGPWPWHSRSAAWRAAGKANSCAPSGWIGALPGARLAPQPTTRRRPPKGRRAQSKRGLPGEGRGGEEG
jgi:hypothetical protein